jgi:hypothetical protein
MNAVPPSMTPGHRSDPAFGLGEASMKWTAVHDAIEIVVVLAGLEPERPSSEVRNFPASMHGAPGWRRELADRAIDDMAAVMEPGIAALLGVNARGADPRPAALALWCEFTAARAAVLALLPPAGTVEPRHGA